MFALPLSPPFISSRPSGQDGHNEPPLLFSLAFSRSGKQQGREEPPSLPWENMKWNLLLFTLLAAICLLVLPTSSTPLHQPDEAKLLHVIVPSGPLVSAQLGASLTLTCLVSLAHPPPAPSAAGRRAVLSLPRVMWSLMDGEKKTEILVARGDTVQVSEAYRGRASLPRYAVSPADLTLRLEGVRHGDGGRYRCEVQQGSEDAFDVTQVKVKGLVFHHQDTDNPNSFTFLRASQACQVMGAQIATPEQFLASFHSGHECCHAGWLSDRSVRYPVQEPREGCLGDTDGPPGLRNSGTLDPEQMFGVYCYVGDITGEVFHGSAPEHFTFWEAKAHCLREEAELASPAQLYAAWNDGLNRSGSGWLKDRSVRYPAGRCVDVDSAGLGNQTIFPEEQSRRDVYCFRGSPSSPLTTEDSSPARTVTEETTTAVEEAVRTVSPVPVNLLETETSTREVPQSATLVSEFHPEDKEQRKGLGRHPASSDSPRLEIFITNATSGPEEPSSSLEEHRHAAEATLLHPSTFGDVPEPEVDVTSPSSQTEELHSSTVSPSSGSSTAEDHPEEGGNLATVVPVVMDTTAMASSEPPSESSSHAAQEHLGVAYVTLATPEDISGHDHHAEVTTAEVTVIPGFGWEPIQSSGRPPGTAAEVVIFISNSTEAHDHTEPVHNVTDEPEARSETTDRESGLWSEDNPEDFVLSNLTKSPEHRSGSSTHEPHPLDFQTMRIPHVTPHHQSKPTSTPLQESGGNTESSTATPQEVSKDGAEVWTTSTTSGHERGQEETSTDAASGRMQGCTGCRIEDHTLENFTDPTVDPQVPTTMAARGEVTLSTDSCQEQPCLNGGTCVEGEVPTCLCLPGYGGALCQTDGEACEDGWEKFQSFCYRHVTSRQSWEGAEQHCRTIGGHLISIMTPEEQHHINDEYKEYQWIGLSDKTIEGDFRWSDGNLLLFENWHRGQPDSYFLSGEDCVAMVWDDGGRWSDVPCNYHLSYTCKRGVSSCPQPPAVANAKPFGKTWTRYETHAKVRYRCGQGFVQKMNPVIACLPGGQWEEPMITCLPAAPQEEHSARSDLLTRNEEEVTEVLAKSSSHNK
ncbi:brevican core protein [Nerophis lumbriciformis]|uniref:brevican core protein n=1 Tax=Nerophis lumbriciformis TaxID=546530 RepID=UPI003BA86144